MAVPSEPFVPNEHQVFVGKIFSVLGALFGIAIIISIRMVVRQWIKRRAAARATTAHSVGPKINLWTFKFPELDHLPPVERETLLRSALESPEIQAFRRRVPIYLRVLSALVTATTVAVIAFDGATHLILLPILVAGAVLMMISAAFIRGQCEARILRRVLNKTLNSPRNGSV
jgi:hypothetical protein